MAALAIGLWLDLPRPYWAMATVYIASQPFSGATISKAAFRAMGTLAGGMAALALVPLLVNAPVLLSLALAGWTGLCLFLALLDRTPRSYAFMLAGYTAAIIGFPSVGAPEVIFDTVVARVEEILLGIGCAAAAASLVFPRAAGPVLASRVSAWLRLADEWAADALDGRAEDAAHYARRRTLAAGMVEIEGLGASLGWDPGAGPGVARAMWALRQHMLLLLPILSSIDDRVRGLASQREAPGDAAMAAVRGWIAGGAPLDGRAGVLSVLEEPDEGRDTSTGGDRDWPGLMRASLVLRLRELVVTRAACAALSRQIAGVDPLVPGSGVGFVHHRDAGLAMLSATAAVVAILLCCVGWIATAWPDGAVAAEMAAVVCSFFAAQDNPVPAIVDFLLWSAVAVVVDGVLLFGLLPLATSFEMLLLALAPIYIVYGLLMARPTTARIGMALAANGSTLLGLQSAYAADFESFANSGLALLVGMAAGAVVTGLMRSVGAEWSIGRLHRANWGTIAEAARGYGRGDRERFAVLLLDRVALIASRLAAAGNDSGLQQLRPLADIRIGLNMVELRRGRGGLPDVARRAVEAALDGLGGHFAELARGRAGAPDQGLVLTLDRALEAVRQSPESEARRNALQGLVGVHRGLCPARLPAAMLMAP